MAHCRVRTGTYYADHLEALNTPTLLPFKLDSRAQGLCTFKEAAVPQNANLGYVAGLTLNACRKNKLPV